MKIVKKRIIKTFVVSLMTILMFSMPVLAATNTFSKSIRLSTTEKTNFSYGSITGKNTLITQVKVYLNVVNGSEPNAFDLYIESPSGTVVTLPPSTKSVTYYINSFNGENPKGTWCAWIERRDETSNPNQMFPMTISATIGVSVEHN